jgi:hypothetical protein
MLHIETSAKTGQNVVEAFSRTALAVYQKLQSGLINIQDSSSGVRGGTENGNRRGSGSGAIDRGDRRTSLGSGKKKDQGGCC